MKKILLSIAFLAAALGLNAQMELVAPPKLTEAADLHIISCTGNPKTGQVSLIVTITPRSFMLNANLAGGWDGRAYSLLGAEYRLRRITPSNTLAKSNIPQGIPFAFEYGIEGVIPGTLMFKTITMPFHVTGTSYDFLVHNGNTHLIEFRNVPIVWQKIEDSSYIRVPFELMKDVELKVVACNGDKASGVVTFEFTTMCKIGGDTKMSLGDSREDKAFDAKGNVSEVKTQRMETRTAPQNTPLKYTLTFNYATDNKEVKVLRIDYTYDNNQSGWGCRQTEARGMIEFHHVPIVWK